jgi:hypothetical protein
MNSLVYNASHKYEHIQRVVMNANCVWRVENHHEMFHNVDLLVIYVAAMVHDTGNEKYRGDEAGEETVEESDEIKQATPSRPSLRWPPPPAHPTSGVPPYTSPPTSFFPPDARPPAHLR